MCAMAHRAVRGEKCLQIEDNAPSQMYDKYLGDCYNVNVNTSPSRRQSPRPTHLPRAYSPTRHPRPVPP